MYGRLFFAGEAVHERYPGTVQAAIETGVRAAQEVCDTSARLRGMLHNSFSSPRLLDPMLRSPVRSPEKLLNPQKR